MCCNGNVPDYGVGEPGLIRAASIFFFWGGERFISGVFLVFAFFSICIGSAYFYGK